VESKGYILIPAHNEEKNVAEVIDGIINLKTFRIDQIILVNNGSTDNTSRIAIEKGINVIDEPMLGYGNACLAGLNSIDKQPEWIMIMDADGSDDPEDLLRLLKCFLDTNSDLVIGSRTIGEREKGSMSPTQTFGNWLTCFLIFVFYRLSFTDLGPLRLIRYQSLLKMKLKDKTWGWNIEMQIRAIQNDLLIVEIPVKYRKRKHGVSKISGTFRMAIRVGIKILYTFFKLTLFPKF